MKIPHLHIIDVDDIAIGVPGETSVPLTGFRYSCVLCGRTYDVITDSGMRQLADGYPAEKVLRWQDGGIPI